MLAFFAVISARWAAHAFDFAPTSFSRWVGRESKAGSGWFDMGNFLAGLENEL
jgi:hypothetical protein